MSKPNQITNNKKGQVLVFLQFALIVLILMIGNFPENRIKIFILTVGVFVGVWAILAMQIRVSIFPEPDRVNKLIVSGPYRLIRHPMYTAVLLSSLAFVNSVVTSLLWALLLAVLLYKLTYEESLLSRKFPGYKAYTTTTKRLLPFIY